MIFSDSLVYGIHIELFSTGIFFIFMMHFNDPTAGFMSVYSAYEQASHLIFQFCIKKNHFKPSQPPFSQAFSSDRTNPPLSLVPTSSPRHECQADQISQALANKKGKRILPLQKDASNLFQSASPSRECKLAEL